MMRRSILVTGAAGFIGFHVSNKLCAEGYSVIGIDNINDYYDQSLKHARLNLLEQHTLFSFQKVDLTDHHNLKSLFRENQFEAVINLAAQAGVRYSLSNPHSYLESNLHGFLNILEMCRHNRIGHLIYASSSSVYGANKTMPFSVHQNVDHPLSLYAATKKANELMAHAYSSLYDLPTTGLRFFSAYGPYGRPDMALFIFTKAILDGRPIDVYNGGKMKRDFTYVDDIVEAIVQLIGKPPASNNDWDGFNPDPSSSFAPYRIFNVGNNQPVELLRFINIIEEKLGKKAIMNFLPMQEGDVPQSFADIDDTMKEIGFRPNTPIETGIDNFINWYKDYYKLNELN
jgi:UDP-glucuronate 4-epimerase